MRLLILWFISALALLIVGWVIPGIHIDSLTTALFAALVMGLINISIAPLAQLISLPVTLITLGLFAFVVNALMFSLAAILVDGFVVTNFLSALIGSILLSLIITIGQPKEQRAS